MTTRFDAGLGRVAALWVERARRRARWVLALASLLTLASVGFALRSLGVNADTEAMLSPELPARRLERELKAAFPALVDNLALVVDAPTPGDARRAARRLAERLRQQPEHFRHVFLPGGGAFFDRHGLLYLEVEELEELADRLAAAQPFLTALAREPDLETLARLLERAVREGPGDALAGFDLPGVLEGLADAVAPDGGRPARPFSWESQLAGPLLGEAGTRQIVLAQPVLDFSRLAPARESLRAVRRSVEELALDPVRVRVTGDPALSAEEMELVRRQATGAGVLSFVLVAGLLGFGLRSLRLVLATVATLAAGLSWTAGFAALAVGHLNLISMSFGVLFIGLGVDFGIHFAMRYRELRARGEGVTHALRDSGERVGSSLLLCALTTAIGFYAFLPTDYAGVAELGLISGTGMFLSLLATLSLLPAIASRMPRAGRTPTPELLRLQVWLPSLPLRRPRLVLAVAAALVLAALPTVPRMRFDANPLNVRDPEAESVRAMLDLLGDERASPWTAELLAPDLAAGRALAERLATLDRVERAITLADFVPVEQSEKLEILADVALFLGPLAPVPRPDPAPLAPARVDAALASLMDGLEAAHDGDARLAASAGRLAQALGRARRGLADAGGAQVARLEARMLGDLPDWLGRLDRALGAGPVALDDLPEELRQRFVAPDGRARVEVFPRGRVAAPGALERFVAAVQDVDPAAAGSAVTIVESADAIVQALLQALSTALVTIALLLLLLWRSVRDTLLVLTPLLLAALLTAAASVLANLPFNFADVIVLPLLLGIGIDSGIHLVHRARHGAPDDTDVLHTSTARAVLFSSLTTIASFSSLAFSTHRGLASLGQLLTLGVGFTLLANLLVLPALLTWLTPRARRP